MNANTIVIQPSGMDSADLQSTEAGHAVHEMLKEDDTTIVWLCID